MAQAKAKNCLEKKCIDVEKVIMEMLPKEERPNHLVKTEKEPFKKDLLKLLKKVELNARYLEDTTPISKIDYQQYWRIFGVY